MREDSVISVELRSHLNLPYHSLLPTSTGAKILWRSFLDRLENVKKLSSVGDFVAFNRPLYLDNELVIPEIVYRKGHQQSSLQESKRTELSAKPQGKKPQHGISQSLGKTNSFELGEQRASEQMHEVNQYITKLLKKRRLHLLPFNDNEDENQNFLNIFSSAFSRVVLGPQAPLSLLKGVFVQKPFHQGGLRDFKYEEKSIGPSAVMARDKVEEDPNQFQIGKTVPSTQQGTEKSTRKKAEARNYHTNPLGLQLLNTLTQNWIAESNQIVVSEDSFTKGPRFTTKVESSDVKALQAIQKENFKNLINLTVQMQGGKFEDEDLVSLGEKVNRILMEQARRYGIDLT
ncbi:MAG: hypothetical protein ACFFCW_00155 [Candidatus Hodarchaeota archaeon]